MDDSCSSKSMPNEQGRTLGLCCRLNQFFDPVLQPEIPGRRMDQPRRRKLCTPTRLPMVRFEFARAGNKKDVDV
jgi:hypothetical protein